MPLDCVEFMERRLRPRWRDEEGNGEARLPAVYDTKSLLQLWPTGPRVRYPSRGERLPPTKNNARDAS